MTGTSRKNSSRQIPGPSDGVTLIEIIIALAVAGILTAMASYSVGKYGKQSRIRQEADQVVNGLWELRSGATTGTRNPCMDFPDSVTVRLYNDTSSSPDGFGPGDRLLRSYAYRGGVTARSILGGSGPTHFVCFESRGMMGSAGAALHLTLGTDTLTRKTVRLLPSTGVAKVL